MKKELIQIAGRNVLGINSEDIGKLVKCLFYLDVQIEMIISETLDDKMQDRIIEVRENAIKLMK